MFASQELNDLKDRAIAGIDAVRNSTISGTMLRDYPNDIAAFVATFKETLVGPGGVFAEIRDTGLFIDREFIPLSLLPGQVAFNQDDLNREALKFASQLQSFASYNFRLLEVVDQEFAAINADASHSSAELHAALNQFCDTSGTWALERWSAILFAIYQARFYPPEKPLGGGILEVGVPVWAVEIQEQLDQIEQKLNVLLTLEMGG